MTKSLLPFLFLAVTVSAADFYVATSGSDSAAGTLAAPLLTLARAVTLATPGSTIYIRAGTYAPSTNIKIQKNGTSAAPYVVRAYQTEKVILDGENMPGTPAALDAALDNGDRGILHIERAWYWKFYNLELKNGPYGIYSRDSSNNYYENIITHDNYETGFQIQGIAANNVVVNLDSYRNRDPRKNGESADGFAIKEGSGTGNVLRGARLWDNVDDGLDFWEFKSAVTVENTISWGNGVNRWGFNPFEGDGNGFKLGGGDAADIGPANHILTNNIAFLNVADGFTDNKQPGTFTLTRNTAYNNGGSGFQFGTASTRLTSNLALLNKDLDTRLTTPGVHSQSGNSWNLSGVTWNNSTLKSVDTAAVKGARTSAGLIVGSDFLVPTSYTIGATTRV